MTEQEAAAQRQAHGWKTYFFAAISVLAGILGAFKGVLTPGEAAPLILGGLIAIGMRDAQAKVIASVAASAAEKKGEELRGGRLVKPAKPSGGVSAADFVQPGKGSASGAQKE